MRNNLDVRQTVVLVVLAVALVVSLASAQPSPVDEQLKKIHKKLASNGSGLGLHITPPTLAVIGLQSAGKTSMIESYLGFRAGFTSQTTGTRCPVKYILHRDLKQKEPRIVMRAPGRDEEQLQLSQLASRVESVMKRIERDEEYTSDVLEIEVWYENTVDIIFLDLPGFVSNSDEKKARHIEQVSLPFARDPQYILVVMIKATEHPETVFDEDHLHSLLTDPKYACTTPPRLDWQRDAIFVVNKINQHFADITTTELANEYLAPRKGKQRYYVILKPDKHDLTPASFAKLEQLEMEEFNNWKAKLAKADSKQGGIKEQWNPSNDQYIGLANAKAQITRHYLDAFRNALPKIFKQITDQLEDTQRQILLAEQSVKLSDPKELRAIYSNYTLDYSRQILALLHGRPIKSEAFGDWTGRSGDDRFCPSSHGETFAEQLDSASQWHPTASPPWRWFIGPEDLKDSAHYGPHGRLGQQLDRKLLGKAAFDRLRENFSYMVLLQKAHEYNNDDIDIMGGNALVTQFPTAEVVQTMVNDKLRSVGKGIEWFLYHAGYIYGSPTKLVRAHLTAGPYRAIGAHNFFLDEVDATYLHFIRQSADRLRAHWYDDVEMYCSFLFVDSPVRSLIGLISQPMENIIPDPKTLHPQVISVETKDAPDIGGQFLGDLNRTNFEVSDRIQKQYASIIELRDQFLAYRKFFPLSELIQGGFAVIPAMDRNHLDYDIVRTMANGYYFGLMERLVFNLEKRSYRVFVSDLIDMLGNSIEKTLTKTWINKTDAELTQQAGVDPKRVQDEFKVLHERKEVLGESHRDVKEVQAILATL